MEVDMEAMLLDMLPGLSDILEDMDFPAIADTASTANAKLAAAAAAAAKAAAGQQEEEGCGWPPQALGVQYARPGSSGGSGNSMSPCASPTASAESAPSFGQEQQQSQEDGVPGAGALQAPLLLPPPPSQLRRINTSSRTMQDTSCGVTMSSPKFKSSVGSPIFNEIARMQIQSPTKKDERQLEAGGKGEGALVGSMRHGQALTSVEARGQSQLSACGVEVVHILLAAAEAVAAGHTTLACNIVSHLKRMLSPHGSAMQRVATYFTNALAFRLGLSLPIPSVLSQPLGAVPTDEALVAYQVFYACCPYLIITHFCANQAILEVFEGERKVHIVDLDIKQGLQWPSLIQALSLRKGGPPALRITAAGGPNDMPTVLSTGARLCDFARSLQVPLEFCPLPVPITELEGWMVQQRPGEVMAVNCVSVLHALVDSPVRPLPAFLAMLRGWEPALVALVEQDASHNDSFIPRFVDALHYYSSMFDSLASTLSSSMLERESVEGYLFGSEIMNIVGCEGEDRYKRHMPVDSWFRAMSDAGFHLSPLSSHSIYQAKFLVGRFIVNLYPAAGKYRVAEEDGYLSLGWQDNPLFAVSCWC